MNQAFSSAQISKVIDQALVYQCACPAQVCQTLLELRELYDYQMQCIETTASDRAVHETIAAAAREAHAAMEACLARLLEIEGWDPATLEMPDNLKKRPAKAL